MKIYLTAEQAIERRGGRMMEIDKLIERLRNAAGGPEGIKMCVDAATALSTLQAELEKVKAERDEAREAICTHCQDVPCRGLPCYWWGSPQKED